MMWCSESGGRFMAVIGDPLACDGEWPVYEPPPRPAAYPHKCPVCDGEGKRYIRGTTAATEVCPACKGACVLWG